MIIVYYYYFTVCRVLLKILSQHNEAKLPNSVN